MAISTFSADYSNTGIAGAVIDDTYVQSDSYSNEGYAEVLFTGTDFEFLGLSGKAFGISIDGGIEFEVVGNGSYATGATGLSDTQHSIRIRGKEGFAWIIKVDAYRVTGAAPSITRPFGYSTPHQIANDPLFTIDGNCLTDYNDSVTNPVVLGLGPYYAIRFKAEAVEISAWIDKRAATYRVYEDGEILTTLTSDGGSGHQRIAFTPSDANEHEFEIVSITGFGFTSWVFIQADNGEDGDGVMGPAPSVRPQIYFRGDSITVAVQTPTVTDGFAFVSSRSLGFGCFDAGVSGIGTQGLADLLADVTSLPNNTAGIVTLIGVNDGNDGPASQDAYDEVISELQGLGPTLPKYFLGILQTNPTSPSRVSFNAMIETQVSAASDPTCVFVPTTDMGLVYYVDGEETDFYDSNHPNNSGHAKIGNAVAALFSPPAPSGGGLKISNITKLTGITKLVFGQ